jgi:hypothetical protein
MTFVAPPSRHRIFISYARADGETAARDIYRRLQAEAPDLSAWLDRFDLEGGVGWWTQIERELDRAEFLLLVMTPAAMRSENTRNECIAGRPRLASFRVSHAWRRSAGSAASAASGLPLARSQAAGD